VRQCTSFVAEGPPRTFVLDEHVVSIRGRILDTVTRTTTHKASRGGLEHGV
jgi:hypothetical protein